MFLQRPNYAMVGRSHASPDGGGFPGDAHRLAAGGFDSNQRSHASPDGGGLPGEAHRLAAGGFDSNQRSGESLKGR
jgi:hypothetical protein